MGGRLVSLLGLMGGGEEGRSVRDEGIEFPVEEGDVFGDRRGGRSC